MRAHGLPGRDAERTMGQIRGPPLAVAERGTKGRPMGQHQFTLIVSDVPEITPELADALYEATGGDIEFNLRDGVAFLEFDRTALLLEDAVTSAVGQVEGAGVGVRVVRAEPRAAHLIVETRCRPARSGG